MADIARDRSGVNFPSTMQFAFVDGFAVRLVPFPCPHGCGGTVRPTAFHFLLDGGLAIVCEGCHRDIASAERRGEPWEGEEGSEEI
jgi:hypothetical protein